MLSISDAFFSMAPTVTRELSHASERTIGVYNDHHFIGFGSTHVVDSQLVSKANITLP